MQRSGNTGPRDPRKTGERDATQPMGGQPRPEDDEEGLQKPDQVPSLLTAREFEARDPARGEKEDDSAGERHGAASSEGPKGEPPISAENPPRGNRGRPDRIEDLPKKTPGGKSR